MTGRYDEFLGNLAQDPIIAGLNNPYVQLRILGHLATAQRPLSVTELSASLHIPQSTVSVATKLLAAAKFINRTNTGSRRTEHTLTDTGRALHSKVTSIFERQAA